MKCLFSTQVLQITKNFSTLDLLKYMRYPVKFSRLLKDLTGSLSFSLDRKYTTDKETMELMPKKRLMQT